MTRQPPLYPVPHDDEDAEAALFEDVLDRYMRGDREALRELDPEMATTVMHMVGLADRSGHRPRRFWQRWATSAFSIAAAVAAVLLLVFIGTLGWRLLRGTPETPPTQVAVLSAPGVPTATTDVSGYALPPLTPADCALSPRTETETLALLSTPPAPGASLFVADQPVEPAVIDDLNATLRGWEVCNRTADLYGAFAYESGQYIRESIYGEASFDQPFSVSTLNEIIAAWQAAMMQGSELRGGELHAVWTIDTTRDVLISPDGSTIEAWMVPIDPRDGTIEDDTAPVRFVFVLEDGIWKIRMHDPAFNPR